jgi:putative transposase
MIHRSTYQYIPAEKNDAYLRSRIREIAEVRVRYGFWRVFILLRREGWKDNHKRVYRIYKEEGLNLRTKRPRRRKAAAHRMERPEISTINQCWSMDFVADQLFNGRRFRALTIVDNFSRKCMAIHADQSIKGADVVDILNRLKYEENAIPKRIQVDNGSEFISKNLDHWAYANNITLDYSRPGKPTDNSFIESFNGSFRDECLNTNWFLSLLDAKQKIEHWRRDYNEFRPHSSLNDLTPNEVHSEHNKRPISLLLTGT